MSKNPHSVVWFEIPVTDIARASAFYASVLQIELKTAEFGPTKMAVFPSLGGDSDMVVHGALVYGDGYKPGADGPMMYLNGGDDLAGPLSRVEAAGGKILEGKKAIGEHGFMALFLDSEGNRLALHSDQ